MQDLRPEIELQVEPGRDHLHVLAAGKAFRRLPGGPSPDEFFHGVGRMPDRIDGGEGGKYPVAVAYLDVAAATGQDAHQAPFAVETPDPDEPGFDLMSVISTYA